MIDRVRPEPPTPGEVEVFVGSREGLTVFKDRTWDVVIDSSESVPRQVRLAAEAFNDRVGRYIFLSSICAYRDFATIGIDEDYPLATMEDATVGRPTKSPPTAP